MASMIRASTRICFSPETHENSTGKKYPRIPAPITKKAVYLARKALMLPAVFITDMIRFS